VDATTGALTLVDIEETGNAATGLAAAQDGRAVYVVDRPGTQTITRYGFDAATGDLTRLGTVGTVASPFLIQTDPDGRFAYVLELTPFAESNTVVTYAIDQVARTLTQVATAATGRTPVGLAFAN
jgi:6-phosphogluconolactonase